MFRFKLAVLLTSLIGVFACAQSVQKTAQRSPSHPENRQWTVALGYVSWQETMDLRSGALADQAQANYYGSALALMYESYFVSAPRHGWLLEGQIMTGKASLGGGQSGLTYQAGDVNWSGATVSTRYAFRLTPQIGFSTGPIVLSRQIDLPVSPNGIDATSGADLNYGAVADLRLRLVPEWELRQVLGTLLVHASTYWSLNLGYKF